jgi:galactokinase
VSARELAAVRLQQQFTDAGFETDDAAGRARLVLQAVQALTHLSDGPPPRWGWFVPGRIEIFGKHTDYAGGRSLLCTVPRGFAVVARPRDDQRIRVVDARWRQRTEIDLGAPPADVTGWSKYVAVVTRRLALDFPLAPLGADIALASDLPNSAGLSSSSALVVALSTVLIRRGDLEERAEWRRALPAPQDLAGYLGAVENGLTFKSFTSAPGVGTDGGSEDHTAILLCRAGQVSAYSYLPVVHHGDADMPADWRFVVLESGIQAAKAGAARDQYNRASRGTRAILSVWHSEFGGSHPHLSAALGADPAAVPAFSASLGSKRSEGFEGADLARRLAHFMAEDARVPAALEAFRRRDRAAVGNLASSSQRDAESLLGNQIPETIALVDLARESGAFAASSFGAGFGGSVWALVNAEAAPEVARRCAGAYAARFPSLPAMAPFTCRPGRATMQIELPQ